MRLQRLLMLTMLLAAATTFTQFGFYFHAEHQLHFSAKRSLFFALSFGVAYAGGALSIHWIERRAGGRTTLSALILACLPLTWVLFGSRNVSLLLAAQVGLALCLGGAWPIIEHAFGQGGSQRQITRRLGHFNLSWGLTSTIGLAASGWLIQSKPEALLLASASSLTPCVLLSALPWSAWPPASADSCVAQSPVDPSEPQVPLPLARRLLAASRVGMLCSYAVWFMVAPLLPLRLAELDLSPTRAALVAAIAFGVRTVLFVVMGQNHQWHGKRWPLIMGLLILPIGLALTLRGSTVNLCMLGQIGLGLSTGAIYAASIDYGLLVSRGQVSGTGGHEAMAGLGYVLGPLLGLGAIALTQNTWMPMKANTALLLSFLPLVGISLLALIFLLPQNSRKPKEHRR